VTTNLTTGPQNFSNIFTPKDEKEVDLISMKYKIDHPIWTDFVRANTSTFYSSSRKAFFTHQQSAFPASDHKTFWNDVGMTEYGTLKNGIQYG